MAENPLTDVNFFKGAMNNANGKSKTSVTGKPRKQPNASNSENRTRKSKENPVLKATPARKSTRISTKNEREPLKVLNVPAKTLKKNVSPSKNKNNVGTRKSVAKGDPIPAEAKPSKKVNQSVPKIIIHKDPPSKTKQSAGGFSKSLDDSNLPGRKSVANSKKSPTLCVENKKVRRSLNDLPRGSENRKSPVKPKSRLSKFKPGEPKFEEMSLKLENLFPNVDPDFVKSVFVKFKGSLPSTIEFLMAKEKNKEAPTKLDFVRRQMSEKLESKFIDNFSVKTFVEMIPDPWNYFLKQPRHNYVNYVANSLHYLKNKYKNHYVKTIQLALKKNNFSLYLANKELKKKKQAVKMRATNRSRYECDTGKSSLFDIEFIHEVAFIENEKRIKAYIKKMETAKSKKVKEAKEAGTLLDCQSCCGCTVLPDDSVTCLANHVFCKDCVVRYVEIEADKETFKLKCLVKCTDNFSLESLQAVLGPTLMASIIDRHDRVKSEKLLVYCPFCYKVTVIPSEAKILKCPGCLLDTCRECKQVNHFPLKCEDIQKYDKTVLEIICEKDKAEEDKEIEFLKQEEKTEPILKCNEDFLKQVNSSQTVCSCGATVPSSVCQHPDRESHHADQEFSRQMHHRLSICSGSTDFSGDSENFVEFDCEENSNGSNNSMEFFLSGSDAF